MIEFPHRRWFQTVPVYALLCLLVIVQKGIYGLYPRKRVAKATVNTLAGVKQCLIFGHISESRK
jgi:hypothetical protein